MSWPQQQQRERASPGAPPPAARTPNQLPPQQPWIPNQTVPPLPQPGGYYGGAVQSPPQYWQQPKPAAPLAPNQNYNQNFAQPPQQQQQQQQPPQQPQYGYGAQQYQSPNANAYFQAPPPPVQSSYDPYNQHQPFNAAPAVAQPPNALVPDSETTDADPWNWGWEDPSAADPGRNAPHQNPTANYGQAADTNAIQDSFTNSSDGWTFSTQDKPSAPSNFFDPAPPVQSDVGQRNLQQFDGESKSNVKSSSVPPANLGASAKGAFLEETSFSQLQFPPSDPFKMVPKQSVESSMGNVPHQWSVESQPSQESTDSASYPESEGRFFDNQTENAVPNNNPIENVDEIVNQELVSNVQSLNLNAPAESSSLANAPISPNMPPINSSKMSTPPSHPGMIPPTTSGSGGNPFKRVGQLSHKNVPLSSPSQVMQISSPRVQESTIQQENFTVRQPSPLINNMESNASSHTSPIAYANLETTPDNSERPDNPSVAGYQARPFPASALQSMAENSEVAPNNDRNEYLQTGHLSEGGFTAHFSDDQAYQNDSNNPNNYPPPGLQRMVLGQPESEFDQNASFGNDEPPPGLSRMVPGHPTTPLNIYNQSNDDYLDRQIDGQTTESDSLTNSACMTRGPVYRQVDGQPTDDETNYNQVSRNSVDRRPVGFDRMIPGGEANSSNFNIPFQNQNFASGSDGRVVTGFEQVNSSEPREQNMDGSDYSEVDANQIRNAMRPVEPINERNADNSAISIPNSMEPTELQRDRNMEGENLQDINSMSVRDQNMDGADTQEELVTRTIDLLDSDQDLSRSTNTKQSNDKDRKYRDDTTGDESERDRLFKINALKKEKEGGSRHRSSRDRDDRRDRRDDRRYDKDRRGDYGRGERDRVNDDRRYKRSKDNRYDTEDTDYYSDKERRRYREGSYSGKPPRPDDRPPRRDDEARRSYDRSKRDDRDNRRRDDREKERKYDNYDSERDGSGRRRERDAAERDYIDREDRKRYSDRDRHYAGSRKDKEGRDERRRGDMRDPRYRPPRPSSRDPEPAEDEYNEERDRRGHRYRRDRDKAYNEQQYYERYGYSMDPYSQQLYQQQQTYQYYEKLRLTNPQAYLEIYNKYMSGATHNMSQSDVSRAMSGYGEGYTSLPGYDSRSTARLGDERGSVHSGRSSTNGEAVKDRSMLDGSIGYYYPYSRLDNSAGYTKHDTPSRTRGDHGSIRTDYSGSRDFNTDASLNLYLDESVLKSDRNTPVKFGTAHIKGVISTPNMVVIRPSYPTDGQPAIVEIINLTKLLSNDPICAALTAYPGPLIKGVTPKKSVIEFCESKIRSAIEKHTSAQDRSPHLIQQFGNNSYSEKSSLTNAGELGSVVLMWELLILLLRQNGIVVGTDIAELLVKNTHQYAWKGAVQNANRVHSRRDSASSATSRSADLPLEDAPYQEMANQDVEHDSSNDISVEQSQSASSTYKKERKSSKDNLIGGKPKRKTSANLYGESSQIQNGEKYVTDKFREYLLFGSGKDALEWAMSHGLWGHALFLASKLDRRTYANVMARFANGLSPNDPLQTLYQLMSGRQPAAVTCVSDDKWGDWRPHLAMILSNASQRPELDKKSITALGDTLNTRGDLFAAQFCYLMARVDFGKRPAKNLNVATPRLVLLGSSPSNENFALFASNDAIMMTEIYEFACNLADDSFTLVDFQFYKYLFATRLMDYGLYDRALFYMERIAQIISKSPTSYERAFLEKVLQVAERLKHYDPEDGVGEILDDNLDQGGYDQSQPRSPNAGEQAWISELRKTVDAMNTNYQNHNTQDYYQKSQYAYDQSQNWPQSYSNSNQIQPQNQYIHEQTDYQNQQFSQEQNQYSPQHSVEKTPDAERIEPPMLFDPNLVQTSNPLYYAQDTGLQNTQQDSFGSTADNKHEELDYKAPQSSDSGYWNQDYSNQQSRLYDFNEPEPVEGKPLPDTTDDSTRDTIDQPRPNITMPNANNASRATYDDQESKPQSPPQQQKSNEKNKKQGEQANKASGQASAGWFGGIFNKLSLKPKNQMILPDDKNPTIVWDPEKKKWLNTELGEDEQESQLQPPPKIPVNNVPNAGLSMPSTQPEIGSTMSPLPPSNNSANIYKLQKGRQIKKSYVDVFNPGGAPMKPLPPASEVLGAPPPTAPPTSYFVPQSAGGNNQGAPSFYNPSDYAT